MLTTYTGLLPLGCGSPWLQKPLLNSNGSTLSPLTAPFINKAKDFTQYQIYKYYIYFVPLLSHKIMEEIYDRRSLVSEYVFSDKWSLPLTFGGLSIELGIQIQDFMWIHWNIRPARKLSFFFITLLLNYTLSPTKCHQIPTPCPALLVFPMPLFRSLLYIWYFACGLCCTAQRWWRMTFVINALTINCQIIAEAASWPLPYLRSVPFLSSSCPCNSPSAQRMPAMLDTLGQSSLWLELKWVI